MNSLLVCRWRFLEGHAVVASQITTIAYDVVYLRNVEKTFHSSGELATGFKAQYWLPVIGVAPSVIIGDQFINGDVLSVGIFDAGRQKTIDGVRLLQETFDALA